MHSSRQKTHFSKIYALRYFRLFVSCAVSCIANGLLLYCVLVQGVLFPALNQQRNTKDKEGKLSARKTEFIALNTLPKRLMGKFNPSVESASLTTQPLMSPRMRLAPADDNLESENNSILAGMGSRDVPNAEEQMASQSDIVQDQPSLRERQLLALGSYELHTDIASKVVTPSVEAKNLPELHSIANREDAVVGNLRGLSDGAKALVGTVESSLLQNTRLQHSLSQSVQGFAPIKNASNTSNSGTYYHIGGEVKPLVVDNTSVEKKIEGVLDKFKECSELLRNPLLNSSKSAQTPVSLSSPSVVLEGTALEPQFLAWLQKDMQNKSARRAISHASNLTASHQWDRVRKNTQFASYLNTDLTPKVIELDALSKESQFAQTSVSTEICEATVTLSPMLIEACMQSLPEGTCIHLLPIVEKSTSNTAYLNHANEGFAVLSQQIAKIYSPSALSAEDGECNKAPERALALKLASEDAVTDSLGGLRTYLEEHFFHSLSNKPVKLSPMVVWSSASSLNSVVDDLWWLLEKKSSSSDFATFPSQIYIVIDLDLGHFIRDMKLSELVRELDFLLFHLGGKWSHTSEAEFYSTICGVCLDAFSHVMPSLGHVTAYVTDEDGYTSEQHYQMLHSISLYDGAPLRSFRPANSFVKTTEEQVEFAFIQSDAIDFLVTESAASPLVEQTAPSQLRKMSALELIYLKMWQKYASGATRSAAMRFFRKQGYRLRS